MKGVKWLKTTGGTSEENKEEKSVDKVATAVNAWFAEFIHNSPAARDTTVFNHLLTVKGELIKRIKEAVN